MAIQKTKNSSIFTAIADAFYAQRKLIGCVFAFFLGVMVLFLAHKLWVIQREKTVQYDFSILMTEYDTMMQAKDPQWATLLEKFEKNYDKHSNSSLLPYYLGYKVKILLNQDKKEEALAVLDKMIDAMAGSPVIALYEMERALIRLDNADVSLRETGLQTLKALAYDAHNDFRDNAQFYLGRYYWATNQFALAREVWQKLVDEQHDEKMAPSPWLSYVQDKLELTVVE